MSQSIKRSTCCENGINPKAVYEFIERSIRENLGINSFMLIKESAGCCGGLFPSIRQRHDAYSLFRFKINYRNGTGLCD